MSGQRAGHPRERVLLVKLDPELKRIFGPRKFASVGELERRLGRYLKKHRLVSGERRFLERTVRMNRDMMPVFGKRHAALRVEMMRLLWDYIEQNRLFRFGPARR